VEAILIVSGDFCFSGLRSTIIRRYDPVSLVELSAISFSINTLTLFASLATGRWG